MRVEVSERRTEQYRNKKECIVMHGEKNNRQYKSEQYIRIRKEKLCDLILIKKGLVVHEICTNSVGISLSGNKVLV